MAKIKRKLISIGEALGITLPSSYLRENRLVKGHTIQFIYASRVAIIYPTGLDKKLIKKELEVLGL